MTFADMDPIEEMMHKSVRAMEPKELFDYTEAWYEGLFNSKLPVDRMREMSLFKRLKRVYGPDAGLIIKWFFVHYNGVAAKDGRFRMKFLGGYEKNWHDKLLDEARVEMARCRKQEKRKSGKAQVGNGFTSAEELLRG